MNIRRSTSADASAIAGMILALARDSGSSDVPQVTGNQIAEFSSGPEPILWIWVAESQGILAGVILLEPMFSTWRGQKGFYGVDLYVSPDFRSQGLGEGLMRRAASEAMAAGGEFLRLEVEDTNPAAKRLYARLGFAEKPHQLMFLEKDGLADLSTAPAIR